ncbi:hypothetical protein [Paenibacillus sp. Y412MC10]|uniref:hypothetical protein n=1 Tax=Geobacillus sp. (strain Y412MC10) TaxID=481743 RepID=UPI0011A642EB|nr:hypothetical protein [Paenibacillus sp. Y412MC10]
MFTSDQLESLIYGLDELIQNTKLVHAAAREKDDVWLLEQTERVLKWAENERAVYIERLNNKNYDYN